MFVLKTKVTMKKKVKPNYYCFYSYLSHAFEVNLPANDADNFYSSKTHLKRHNFISNCLNMIIIDLIFAHLLFPSSKYSLHNHFM